jgi:peptidoglycan glycosyltransferase
LRDLRRLAAWGLVALAAATALAAWLALRASSDLFQGRERLLAGDTASAAAAFASARHWPGASTAARAGRAASAARAGRATAESVSLPDLEALAPEALVLSAVAEGRLEAAGALADLARRAGHPLGDLYAAALAFERGDEAEARALAAQSPVPLASRGLGSRLVRALEAREKDAHKLLFDRSGALVAIVGREGGIEAEPGTAPLLAGVLERLPALPEGGAARLSVDAGLSRVALEALGEHRGSIVLVEPRTGAVLAAVSDERTAAAEGAAAFTQRREPASIAKLLTLAAAYRAGVDADVEIKRMTCGGVERYGGKPLWCTFAAGPLEGLDHALALSCNVAFANLGTRLGSERMVAEYRLWGFDAGERALLGAAGRVHTPPRDLRQLADLSVGLELADVTPLHAALLAAVVANDGRMPEPRLVSGACGALGLRDEPLPLSAGRDVLERAIARRLRRAMEAVAQYGTGVGLAPPGFPVAMKTGTAAEWGRGYHVNYIGMGPLPDPAIAFCVRVTNERSSPAVTRAARDVTRRLLTALADRHPALDSAARRERRLAGVEAAR